MRRVLGASIILLALVSTTACTSQSELQSQSTPSASATPSPTPFTGDLRTLLVPVPDGATPRTVEAAPDGTVNLDQAAQIWLPSNPELAKEALQGRFYEDGAIVSWATGEETVVVQLLRFADRLSARGHQRNYEDFVDSYPGFERREDLSGVEGATLTIVALDGGTSAYAVAHKNAIVIQILYVVTGSEIDVSQVSELLEQQYALLP